MEIVKMTKQTVIQVRGDQIEQNKFGKLLNQNFIALLSAQ